MLINLLTLETIERLETAVTAHLGSTARCSVTTYDVPVYLAISFELRIANNLCDMAAQREHQSGPSRRLGCTQPQQARQPSGEEKRTG